MIVFNKQFLLRFALLASVALASAGCGGVNSTLDLLTVAQQGLRLAAERQQQQHGQIVQHLQSNLAALDSAFDADVKLAAAGQIMGANGEPVQLTADWVISARKGYIAARSILTGQIHTVETSHAQSLENLKAAGDALQMAAELTVRRWQVAEQAKQYVLQTHRSLTND